MAKSGNQKIKILYLREIMLRRSDDQHPLSAEQLVEALEAYGIQAERKAIYDDLEVLREYGMDIQCRKGRSGGYFVGERDFELAELKLLVDAVQASKFITGKKSMQLIDKLEKLTGNFEGRRLQHQVYVSNRVKTMNESIFYNVDTVNEAINEDSQISFRYVEYTVEKEKRFRREGSRYVVSPYALAWQDENYYLISYDDERKKIRHFRVDKMDNIQLLRRSRLGKEVFDQLDMAVYTKKLFGMFGGEERRVRLRLPNRLVGVLIDWFGKKIPIIPRDDGTFEALVQVEVSPQFFGWLFGLGSECEILAPADVREQYRQQLQQSALRNR